MNSVHLFASVPTALLNYRGGCGVILLDYVECDGSEDRLSDCDHNPFYNLGQCSHHRDAGVRCLSGNKLLVLNKTY